LDGWSPTHHDETKIVNIGIIQGRLSKPTEGFQECPVDWKREFTLLPVAGLTHIEWIVTHKSFYNNPFFDIDLTKYAISSVCADNLVDNRIADAQFLKDSLLPICDAALKNNVKNVTIPILEDSDLSDNKKRDTFCNEITEIGKIYSSLNFSFEIENIAHVIADIVYLRDNFYLTYDTGNMTSVQVDHERYLRMFFNKINNVHLKDRDVDNNTVTPGTGATDFNKIFAFLKKRGYNNNYTLQTAREDGDEFETILRHKKNLEKIYEQSV
jgi:L-ribulose-5-phosphate 3-epimerase